MNVLRSSNWLDCEQFPKSRRLQQRAHQVIPGGSHTYAKGDDQFPWLAPGFVVRGKGCHVWDLDGHEYIEYGMGCRAVGLGHAFEPVIEAVQAVLQDGTNFCRPNPLEVECAEELLSMIPGAEMCKFSKDGSSVTTAAIKLARAATGRDKIALCADHPFFATYDWFIGTTEISGGIPQVVRDLSLKFRYNDPESLRHLFRQYPGEIAAVILEPAKYDDPQDNYLHQVQQICHQHGAVFILDEMITGFRWANGGAQQVFGIQPDLSCFGKALANGFSVSALVGNRELMERGGLYHDRQRVFLLSTTHGAESTALAAALATMRYYQSHPVIETMARQGEILRQGLLERVNHHGVQDHVKIIGKPSALVFGTNDADGKPSQEFRALLMQELIRHGVLGPSLVISYSHSREDVAATLAAFDAALPIYREALERGYEHYLVGPGTQPVYLNYNRPAYQKAPW